MYLSVNILHQHADTKGSMHSLHNIEILKTENKKKKKKNRSLGELRRGYYLVLLFSFDCKFVSSRDRCACEMALFKSLIRVFDPVFINGALPETTLSK